MSSITTEREAIIAQYPIGDSLDDFNLPDYSRTTVTRTITIIITLADQDAARYLPSDVNRARCLADDLKDFKAHLKSTKHVPEAFEPVYNAIKFEQGDSAIWAAVYTLIQRERPPTPEQTPLEELTPTKSVSESLVGRSQSHKELDGHIEREIDGCVFLEVESYFEHFFEGKTWSKLAKEVATSFTNKDKRSLFPTKEKDVVGWFDDLYATYLKSHQVTRGMFGSSGAKPLQGPHNNRKPDIFMYSSSLKKKPDHWNTVLVHGELKESKTKKQKEEVVSFADHARAVFAAQPLRCFLHGFFIRKSELELWMVDRSGLYSAEPIDFAKDKGRFIQVIASFTFMSDEELGINTFVKHDALGKFIMMEPMKRSEGSRSKKPPPQELRLEDEPFVFRNAVVCRGTTCFRARHKSSPAGQWQFVVKFAWRSAKRTSEGELLQIAKDKGAWGVAELFTCQDLHTVANFRGNLQFLKPINFKTDQGSISANLQSLSLHPRSKDKAQKKLSSGSKAKSQKNLGSNDEDQMPYDNRQLSCIVISPPGDPISAFKNVVQLLEACRDCIKAHQSLFLDAGILHRDVSENNLIIPILTQPGDAKGMLIDLDHAKLVGGGRSGTLTLTGTRQFMAMGVLSGKVQHNYRHDLESFLYVMLWVLIRHPNGPQGNLPEQSLLRDWVKGSYRDMFDKKNAHMGTSWGDIVQEITSNGRIKEKEVEPIRNLLTLLRSRLFGKERLGVDWEKAPVDSQPLYKNMIDDINHTIDKLA